MTRIRPRLIDWQMARELEWLEAHFSLVEHCPWMGSKPWVVYASEDVHEDGIHGEYATLREAIEAGRELLEKG